MPFASSAIPVHAAQTSISSASIHTRILPRSFRGCFTMSMLPAPFDPYVPFVVIRLIVVLFPSTVSILTTISPRFLFYPGFPKTLVL